MKINGLLGLVISLLSIGSMAEAQVVRATYATPANTIYRNVSTASYYSTPTVLPTIQRTTHLSSPAFSTTTRSGLAQSKAQRAANMGLRGHLGGGLGGAKYEGVGWSNQSPQSAIQSCCYWGTRPVSQIGVAKGNDGCWYACVLYH